MLCTKCGKTLMRSERSNITLSHPKGFEHINCPKPRNRSSSDVNRTVIPPPKIRRRKKSSDSDKDEKKVDYEKDMES